MSIGIDKIAFYVPQYYIDMADLAAARNVDPNKYLIGIGQKKMAVLPATQDIVTFGANAAAKILTAEDREKIDLVIVGTESSHDFSKSAAVVIHDLLKIQPFARCYEVKQACYGGTAALQQAKDYLQTHPGRKALVIASDIAKYGLDTAGEPTQGAGAVAMLVAEDPQILALNDDNRFYSKDIYDFWRPAGEKFPLVDGKLSNETYKQVFQILWKSYRETSQTPPSEITALLFHIPYTKMGKKALETIIDTVDEATGDRWRKNYQASIQYNQEVGNLYTGSLYLSLLSFLEKSATLKDGEKLVLFSYGSGAEGEIFSGTIQAGFRDALDEAFHQRMLDSRQALSVADYERMFTEELAAGRHYHDPADYSIAYEQDGIRHYQLQQ